jgi:hypothetical protein
MIGSRVLMPCTYDRGMFARGSQTGRSARMSLAGVSTVRKEPAIR